MPSKQTESVPPQRLANEGAEALLRRLEWSVIRRLDGLLQGDYRTLMRGAGLDLADLREYQHHDDVRHMDWNVTARLQQPHVRVFTEDREMAAWFVLDLSGSVNFGSGDKRKRQTATEFVAALSRLLTRHGNRVGAVLFGGNPRTGAKSHAADVMVPARADRRHVLHLLHVMQRHRAIQQADQGSFLGEWLRLAGSTLHRRSTVFVVSDFISDGEWADSLGALAQHHDVIAVRLYDPLEHTLPDLGELNFEDAETGEHLWVDTSDKAFRQRFEALAAEREAATRQAFVRSGVDTFELSTDDDLLNALLRFTQLRRRRVQTHAQLMKVA